MKLPAGQAVVGDAAEPCSACGAPAAECGCARVRDALLARAATLRHAGMRAAREGEFHRAISLLRRSAQLAPLEMDSARVLGLAALCLGEIGIAAEAWRRADAPEMALLDDGPVRDALAAYNEALAAAQAGDAAAANERIEQVLAAFPDLVPAHRLRALLAADAGDAVGARAACEAGLAVCADDAVLLRCLASVVSAAAGAASLAAVASLASMNAAVDGASASPSAEDAAADARSASRDHAAARAGSASPDDAVSVAAASRDGERRSRTAIYAGVGTAWAASIVLAVVLTRGLTDRGERIALDPHAASATRSSGTAPAAASNAPPAAAAPTQSPAPVPAPQPTPAAAFDFAAYRRGRDAYGRGAWREAADELSPAAAVPVEAYFRDDALYLLARAQGRIAARDQARRTAALLLRDYPESIFANRITRRIAAQGSE